jgi:hypothetical protein
LSCRQIPGLDLAVGLERSGPHPRGHVGRRVADVDLPDRDRAADPGTGAGHHRDLRVPGHVRPSVTVPAAAAELRA